MRLRDRSRILLALLLLALVLPSAAGAWVGDFFEGGASGQAVIEAMAIHPQSIEASDGATYVVYQGKNLDPYVVRLTASGDWEGPVRIGTNPLSTGKNPDDTHGAPSIAIDRLGYLHVFWGTHLTRLKHARSAQPLSIWEWVQNQPVPPHNSTYSQPFLRADGTIVLSYRLDSDWKSYTRGSWMLAELGADGSRFDTATAIVSGDKDVMWYGNTRQGPDGRVHGVFLGKAREGGAFERERVYYLCRDTDGVWRDVQGSAVATRAPERGVTVADLESTATAGLVYGAPDEIQNQAVVAVDESGRPGVLFSTGSGYGPDSYRWVFSEWTGSEWTSETVTTTDHSFDSATLEFTDEGVEAFVTMAGSVGAGPTPTSYDDRGGSIVRFTRSNEATAWRQEETIAEAQPAKGVLYNDSQMVADHDSGPRVLFGEWNNDGANFVHKVFLWGDDGFFGREFFPSIQRIYGTSRYAVAAATSRTSFPLNADTVIVANGTVFSDALAGAPLANAYSAPILLTPAGSLHPDTAAEIARLKATTVIVLGGTSSVSTAVEKKLRATGSVTKVRRLGGKDRYETAALIASDLAAKRGLPDAAFVVSGEAFADGLAAGSLAAARSMPILLTRPGDVPAATSGALDSLGVPVTYVVGGPASVSPAVEAELPLCTRIAGADRYETAAALAEFALDGSPDFPASFRTDRLFIASGEVFPDALAASAFSARVRGPLLLTRGNRLAPPTESFLRQRAYRVLDCYVMGGERTIEPTTVDGVADALRERQDD